MNLQKVVLCTIFLAVLQLTVQQEVTSVQILKNLLFQAGSESYFCHVKLRDWVSNSANGNITNLYYSYEKQFQYSCETTSDFYLYGEFTEPSLCETINFCNSTYCQRFTNEAMKFVYQTDRACANSVYTQDESNTYVDLKEMKQPYLNFSQYHSYGTLRNLEVKVAAFTSARWQNKTTNKALGIQCENIRDLFVMGLNNLPKPCSDIRLCTKESCFVFPQITFSYANFYEIRDSVVTNSFELPTECPGLKVQRRKRSVHNEQPYNTSSGVFRSVLNFNLPGYRFCGPGTNIEVMDDNGGPVNELDELCRSHDVDYMIGVKPEDADTKLLEGMWKLRHPYLPLFAAVLEAKRYFELVAGEDYTSSLYYFPEKQQSLTYLMWKKSVYDDKDLQRGDYKTGKELETRWQKLLHGIWLGHCYASTYTPYKLAKEPGTQTLPAGQQQTQQSGIRPPNPQQASSSQESTSTETEESQINVVNLEMYPPIPPRLDRCRMVLSEVLPKYPQDTSFVEIQRVCPTSVRSRVTRLFDFHILIVRISDPSTIYMSCNLHTYELRQVKEVGLKTRTPRNNYYFVIGSENFHPDLSFTNIRDINVRLGEVKGIPAGPSSTYAIILLHFPTAAVHSLAEKSFRIENPEDALREKHIDEEQRYYIQKYVQDIIIYGAPCPVDLCDEFTSLMPLTNDVEEVNNYFIPVPYPVQPTGSDNLTINRCTEAILPMQLNDYAEGIATPGARNNCPVKTDTQRFNLKGTTLQSTAQKVIINAHDFFHRYVANPVILEGNQVSLTAQVCSVSENSVRKILENWRQGIIYTPGKKRPHPLHKQCQLDDFDLEMIRKTIQEFFAAKQPPFVANVFAKFKQKILENEDVRRRNGENVVPFSCGEKTFRRILHRMGFHFGNINYRAVLLMKPNIVMWRGKYLQALNKNKQSPNPLKVIYLDETWIDPHARTGKAWVPKKCKNYREAALYSFPGHKPSRGPRLIILNAGGEDGMFHPAMEVFPVHKSDVKGDYHDNVNGKFYVEWFKRLLDELDKTGNKYIIVQDNAPYHGSSDIPKQRDRKEVMYNWLADNLPLIHLPALEPMENYRKFELWAFVKQLKASKNFFTIDKMAEQRGHRVLRSVALAKIKVTSLFLFYCFIRIIFFNYLEGSLPPYNCDLNPIEYVWKDVKDAVKKQNVDQNLRTVEELAKKIMLEYPVEKWKRNIAHVEKIAKEYWEADGMYEGYMENEGRSIVIPVNDDDEDEDREYDALPVDPDVVTSSVHDDLNASDDEELLDI